MGICIRPRAGRVVASQNFSSRSTSYIYHACVQTRTQYLHSSWCSTSTCDELSNDRLPPCRHPCMDGCVRSLPPVMKVAWPVVLIGQLRMGTAGSSGCVRSRPIKNATGALYGYTGRCSVAYFLARESTRVWAGIPGPSIHACLY